WFPGGRPREQPPGLREGEHPQVARRDDTDELLAALRRVCHRVRVRTAAVPWRGERLPVGTDLPQLLAGLRIERPEASVAGCAHEAQAPGRHRRAGATAVAEQLLALRHVQAKPEHGLPEDLAGIRIDRNQLAPWGADAGHAVRRERMERTFASGRLRGIRWRIEGAVVRLPGSEAVRPVGDLRRLLFRNRVLDHLHFL